MRKVILGVVIAFGLLFLLYKAAMLVQPQTSQSAASSMGGSDPGEAATPATPAPAPAPADLWNVSTEVSPLDGKKHTTVTSTIGDFVVRCLPKFEGYVIPVPEQILSSDELDGISEDNDVQTIRYRLDSSKVRVEQWDISTDQHALFIPKRTLERAVRGETLVVEYTPFEKASTTYTVDLTGLREVMQRAGCPAALTKTKH